MNLSMIPAEVDPRVKARLDRDAAEAARHAEEARRSAAANFAAYEKAYSAWAEAQDRAIATEGKRSHDKARARADQLWLAADSAYKGALSASAARIAGERRLAELENPVLVALMARREQEKRERLDLLRELREAEAGETDPEAGVTRVPRAAAEPRRDYPQVTDNGDGLAQMDREGLRALCREHGLGVGGHKAVVIDRLREAGVTA